MQLFAGQCGVPPHLTHPEVAMRIPQMMKPGSEIATLTEHDNGMKKLLSRGDSCLDSAIAKKSCKRSTRV